MKEEEEKMIGFVRNDCHVSKSVPPWFREHTKMVIAILFSCISAVC